MVNDAESVRELEELRRQYQELGQTSIELLSALDAVVKRGDAVGSVGPRDRVWRRAKGALERATGGMVEPREPAPPLREAWQQLQHASGETRSERLSVVSQMEQLQHALEIASQKLSNLPSEQWSVWVNTLLARLEDGAEADEFQLFLHNLRDEVDGRLSQLPAGDQERT